MANSKVQVTVFLWLMIIGTQVLTFVQCLSVNRTSQLSFGIKGDDDDDDEDDKSDEDCGWVCSDEDFIKEWKLSDGAIAGIVIAVVIAFFVVPVLLCFFCAWCCFKGRRGQKTPIVAIAAPIPQYNQAHMQNNGRGQVPDINGSHYYNNYGTYAPPSANITQVGQNQPSVTTAPAPYPQQLYVNQFGSGADNDSHVYERPPPYYDFGATQYHQPVKSSGTS